LDAEETRLFEELMAWREDVFKICLGFSRNPSDAEDLSQDVYLKALRKIGTVQNPGAARSWLLRIARNTCLDHRKKTRLFQLFKDRAAAGEPRAPAAQEDRGEAPERLARLKRAVAKLGRKQKEVFVLREYGELSYEEIAGTLDVKIGTVMSRLNRARRSVAGFMREESHG
jgi:RNA polymerase sigma-70 factor (ECF subfamily)